MQKKGKLQGSGLNTELHLLPGGGMYEALCTSSYSAVHEVMHYAHEDVKSRERCELLSPVITTFRVDTQPKTSVFLDGSRHACWGSVCPSKDAGDDAQNRMFSAQNTCISG